MRKLILLLSAVALSVPAAAQTFTGTTSLSDPTFNRPLAGSPPTGLSGVGTAVHYQTITFEVTADGNYDFLLHGDTPTNWDTYLGLYQGSFDPGAPLTNALAYNDDFPSIGLSGFTVNLMTGTSYIALITSFDNASVGAWTLNVNGPGEAVTGSVPEPASWALMLGGFGLVGGAMRSRRKVAVSFG